MWTHTGWVSGPAPRYGVFCFIGEGPPQYVVYDTAAESIRGQSYKSPYKALRVAKHLNKGTPFPKEAP